MNHRKIGSQGYVPFSWEEKPGIPKFINPNKSKSSSDMDMAMVFEFDNLKIMSEENEGRSVAPSPALPRKSCNGKGLRWRDDPFFAALKSCTKEEKNLSKRSFFHCKHSCNVEDNNLVNFSKLPPIPKQRYYARSFVRNLN